MSEYTQNHAEGAMGRTTSGIRSTLQHIQQMETEMLSWVVLQTEKQLEATQPAEGHMAVMGKQALSEKLYHILYLYLFVVRSQIYQYNFLNTDFSLHKGRQRKMLWIFNMFNSVVYLPTFQLTVSIKLANVFLCVSINTLNTVYTDVDKPISLATAFKVFVKDLLTEQWILNIIFQQGQQYQL